MHRSAFRAAWRERACRSGLLVPPAAPVQSQLTERLSGRVLDGEAVGQEGRAGGGSERGHVPLRVLPTRLDERTIPAEVGLVEASVCFTKGCYTGQELVAPIDSRGVNVPRHLRGLLLTGPAEVGERLFRRGAPAAEEQQEETALPVKDVGRPTSVALSSRLGWVALGFVGRSVDVGESLLVRRSQGLEEVWHGAPSGRPGAVGAAGGAVETVAHVRSLPLDGVAVNSPLGPSRQ
jgi:folate-binding protein YgfZ